MDSKTETKQDAVKGGKKRESEIGREVGKGGEHCASLAPGKV